MVKQPQVFLGGSKRLFKAYVQLPNPGAIAFGKFPLLLALTVMSLRRQYFVFSTARAESLVSWFYTWMIR
jgi:hypothetical protein